MKNIFMWRYDLISRISDTVLNENNNLIISMTVIAVLILKIFLHDVSNQNECEDIILNNHKNVEDFLISVIGHGNFLIKL